MSLRIAMIIARYPPHIGGTEIQCQRLSEALAARGHHVTIWTERRDNTTASFEQHGHLSVRRLSTWGNPPWSSLHFCFQLACRLPELLRADVWHAHMTAAPAIMTLLMGRLTGKKTLVKIAGAHQTGEIFTARQTYLGRWKLRLLKRWAGRVVCPSQQAKKELEALGFRPEQLARIPNGIPLDKILPITTSAKAEHRRALHLPENDRIAVYAGRSDPGKGVDLLLQLWQQSSGANEFQWTLLILTTSDSFQAQRSRMGLSSMPARVHVVENATALWPYYQASDVAILLSKGEGLSNFLLEAMACGLPVLTTAEAAPAPESEQSRWGWQVQLCEAVPETKAILMDLQNASESLEAKGKLAADFVRKTFAINQVADQYETLYSRLLGNKIA